MISVTPPIHNHVSQHVWNQIWGGQTQSSGHQVWKQYIVEKREEMTLDPINLLWNQVRSQVMDDLD